MQCNAIQYNAMQYNTIQCNAITIQYDTVQYKISDYEPIVRVLRHMENSAPSSLSGRFVKLWK